MARQAQKNNRWSSRQPVNVDVTLHVSGQLPFTGKILNVSLGGLFVETDTARLVGDTIEYCAKEAPKYTPVSVCGYHIRESGATPAQEIAYAFCIAKAYADEVLARGLPIDEFAGRLSFNFNVFGNLFEQVCKFRAARGRDRGVGHHRRVVHQRLHPAQRFGQGEQLEAFAEPLRRLEARPAARSLQRQRRCRGRRTRLRRPGRGRAP